MTKTGRRLAVVVASLAAGGVVFCWLFVREPDGVSLPAVDEIATMEAKDYRSRGQTEFSVPRANWESVLDALQPAWQDRNPAKWQVLGELTLTTTAGNRFQVFLFSVREGAGAFAVGTTWENRVYYRGGDSEKLKQALRNAEGGSP